MRKLFSLLCLALLSAYLISSCKPDLDVVAPGEELPPVEKPEAVIPGNLVTATVQGRVLHGETPIGGATVSTTSGSSVTTDTEGHFTLQNVQLDPDAGFVKVEKTGYFTGSRTFLATANGVSTVTISLIAKTVTGSFDASAGGKATFPMGTVTLPPAGVVNADSTPYHGTVSVASFYIDPTRPSVNELMPGDLRGLTTAGEERGLQSFGMMAVELEGANKEKLQVAPGKLATLSFAIPASLQATAPATIPLWYFDEKKGLWQEQGSATRQGNTYVGTVSHFSYWNCDAPFPVVSFQAVIKDAAGQALPGVLIDIRQVKDSLTRSARTDANGRISGKIPANQPLDLVLRPNACGQSGYTKRIGPFAADTDLGVIATTYDQTAYRGVVVSGKVETCTGSPFSNGYLKVSYDYETHGEISSHCVALNSDGSYQFTARTCPEKGGLLSIMVIEKSPEKNSAEVSAQIPANQQTYTAQTLRVGAECGLGYGNMRLTVGDNTYAMIDWPDDVRISSFILNNQPHSRLGASSIAQCENFERTLLIELNTAGTIDSVGTYAVLPSKVYIGLLSPTNAVNRYTFTGGELNVTEFREIGSRETEDGGYFVVSGSYTGKVVKVGTTTELPFTCTFTNVRKY